MRNSETKIMIEEQLKCMLSNKIPGQGEILLAVSPAAETTAPALGIHFLHAACRDTGIDTSVLYLNVLYSRLIGNTFHSVLSSDGHLLLGERLFASAAFERPSVSICHVKHKFAAPAWAPDHIWNVPPRSDSPPVPIPVSSYREWLGNMDLDEMETSTTLWLNGVARQVAESGYRIVGCSTTLGGLVPAAAFLHCVKKANPDIVTVLGGAHCEGEMAEGIHSLKTGIDYVFSGEGEITFPVLARNLLDGQLPAEKIIYGQNVEDLDLLPVPDYRDYVKQCELFSPDWESGKKVFALPFQASRGCAYGKCTFCAMNGEKNHFRKRTADGFIEGVRELFERNPMKTRVTHMNDSMMPLQYLKTVLPRLSAELPDVQLRYEVKADLTLEQVLILKNAGVTQIQPGIESLSPSLLRKMNKPTTVRKNIALLRYARSVNIDVCWNILFGFPGDLLEEYECMIGLLPLLRHLCPPRQMYPLKLSRFSFYHSYPEKYGLGNLQPSDLYRDILPPQADRRRTAYYFKADFDAQSHQAPELINALWDEFRAWSKAWQAYRALPMEFLLPTLRVTRNTGKTNDEFVLEDNRGLPGGPKRIRINRQNAFFSLVTCPRTEVPARVLDWALENRLAVILESWYIPLATAPPELLLEFEREYERELRGNICD